MQRKIAAGLAIIASAFVPIQAAGFTVLADQPIVVGQPSTSPPTSPVPQPPTYPPEWECPAAALGPEQDGLRFGTPFVPSGQLIDFTPNFTVVAPGSVLASLSIDAPVMVRCPLVNSQNILTHDVTNWVSPGHTILEWVCFDFALTVPGRQLIQDQAIPASVLENCGSGGNGDTRRGNVKI